MKPKSIVNNSSDLSDILKSYRKNLHLSQADLSESYDLSRFTVGDVESGRGDPKLSTLLTLLGGLGLKFLVVPVDTAARIEVPDLYGKPDKPDIPTADEMFSLNFEVNK